MGRDVESSERVSILTGNTENRKTKIKWIGIIVAIIVLVCLILGLAIGLSKGKKGKDDGNNNTPNENFSYYGFNDLFNSSFSPRYFGYEWSSHDGAVYYYQDGDANILKFDIGTQTTTVLLNATELNQEGQTYQTYVISPSERYILLGNQMKKVWRHSYTASYTIFNVDTKSVVGNLTTDVSPIQNVVWSPSKTEDLVAFVQNYNVFVANITNDNSVVEAVTLDGSYNELIYGIQTWVYEEEVFGDFNAIWWSQDGSFLAFFQTNESVTPLYTFTEYDGTPYESQTEIPYPKPGYKNPIVNIACYHVPTKFVHIETDSTTYEYIFSVKWNNENQLFIQTLNREQNSLQIIKIIPSVPTLLATTEIMVTYTVTGRWIDVFPITFLSDGSFVTIKASDLEFNHIVHYSSNGTQLSFLTSGEWEVSAILGYNSNNNTLYYSSTEISSMERHIYSINVNGEKKTRIDTTPGYFGASFSIDSSYFVLTYSGPNVPYQSLYLSSNLEKVKDLSTNENIKNFLSSYKLPTFEWTQIPTTAKPNTQIIYPPNFDSSKKYPVLLAPYGGPGSQSIIKTWSLGFNSYVASQLNTIVVSVDGRGTGGRGYGYSKYAYESLGQYDVIDQVAAADYMKSKSFVDSSKIVIWGWSYGGYLSLSVLSNATETFKAAICVAPVTNWLFYDSVYTERYMNLPTNNVIGYEIGNALKHANSIKDNQLLVVHGTGDDNVHFENTAELVKVLAIENNIQFRSQFYTNSDHGINNGYARRNLYRLLSDYLSEKFE